MTFKHVTILMALMISQRVMGAEGRPLEVDISDCIRFFDDSTTPPKEAVKCFKQQPGDEDHKIFRSKINALIQAAEISSHEVQELTKNSRSLKEAYFALGQAHPIKHTCEKIESDYQKKLEAISNDYDTQSDALNCHLPSSDRLRRAATTR